MKFSFRKIASIAMNAIMLGCSVGAAANWPAPFVSSGQADVAVVQGASAATSDYTAALSIQTSLSNALGSSGTTVTVGEGEKWKVQKSNDNFNLGDSVSGLKSNIDSDELPVLLADGTFRSDAKEDYDFEQSMSFGGDLVLEHFQETDYAEEPVIGMNLEAGISVLNYTLDFTDSVDSELDGQDLIDLETTSLTILGKEYYVLDAKNDTKKITLLDSANEATVSEGTPSTIAVGSKSYTVSIVNINTDEVKLNVNDEVSDSLEETETYKLSDGTYVGIKDISYNAKESGISSVEISIGNGKLLLEEDEEVELNGEAVDGVKVYIDLADSSGKVNLNSITIEWILEDDSYITPTQGLLMPGFEAVKLLMGGMTFPKAEETRVENKGETAIQIIAEIADGKATIPVLYGNGTTFTANGKDTDSRLKVASSEVILNTTLGEKFFVATCQETAEGESYYLEVTSIEDTDGKNETTISNVLDSSDEETVEEGDSIDKFGDLSIKVNDAKEYSSKKGWVNLTLSGCTASVADRIITEEGLVIKLPTAGATATTSRIDFIEEDEDDNIAGGGAFNASLAWTTDGEAYVNNVLDVTNEEETGDGTKVYQSYVVSELATQVLHDTGPDQATLKVVYHGEESYADFFVASPSVSTGAGSGLSVVVKDSEVSSVSGKNLVVIGGSCVNTVAAQVLGVSSGTCGSAFTAATGVGANQALIQVATSPLASSKVAMLIAGYEAEDTTKAATYVTTNKPSTAVGKLVFDSATLAATAA